VLLRLRYRRLNRASFAPRSIIPLRTTRLVFSILLLFLLLRLLSLHGHFLAGRFVVFRFWL
jgi:hypothetical protein